PRSGAPRELRLGSLDSKESRLVARLDSKAEYVAPGYLVYAREGALFAQPFDERTARLHGEPRLIVDDIYYFMNIAAGGFSVSQNGLLVYITGWPTSNMLWFSRDGKEIGLLGTFASVRAFRISPDGSNVAMGLGERRTGAGDIWLFDRGRGISTRLHSDP